MDRQEALRRIQQYCPASMSDAFNEALAALVTPSTPASEDIRGMLNTALEGCVLRSPAGTKAILDLVDVASQVPALVADNAALLGQALANIEACDWQGGSGTCEATNRRTQCTFCAQREALKTQAGHGLLAQHRREVAAMQAKLDEALAQAAGARARLEDMGMVMDTAAEKMAELEGKLKASQAQVDAAQPLLDWARATLTLRDASEDVQTRDSAVVLDVRGQQQVRVTVGQLRAAVGQKP